MQNVYPAGLELDAGAILSRHCWVDRVGEMFTHQSLVSFLVSFFKALCPWTLAKRTHPDYPTRMTQKLKIQNRATSFDLKPIYELIQNCPVLPFSRQAYCENTIKTRIWNQLIQQLLQYLVWILLLWGLQRSKCSSLSSLGISTLKEANSWNQLIQDPKFSDIASMFKASLSETSIRPASEISWSKFHQLWHLTQWP